MRIRQVKPEFWRDHVIAELPDSVRLVYIGLWMEADDAGYLRLDTTEIALDLYPLTTRTVRERRLADALAVLVNAGRVVVQPCERHATIPTLTEHQRLAIPDRRVHTVQREHVRECSTEDRGESTPFHGPPQLSKGNGASKGASGGKERGGVGGNADGVTDVVNDNEETEFRRLVPLPSPVTGRTA